MTQPLEFDAQPTACRADLVLRPLQATDFDDLFAAASDPEIWAGHPVKDRYKPDVFRNYFEFLLGSGGTLVIVKADKIIGCTRYYTTPGEPQSISIGFTFITTKHWGGPLNLAIKTLMLDHAFAVYPNVWFHIDPKNIRSQKATTKLGATYIKTTPANLSGSNANWMWFQLSRASWHNRAA